MSVTFRAAANAEGRPLLRCTCDFMATEYVECVACKATVNLANVNAADLLRWLGFDPGADLMGSARGRDVAAACRRRLAEPEANDPGTLERRNGDRVVICGRRPGRLRERAAELLAIAERAGDLGWVSWS